jgi:hypothetical protein
VTRSTLPPTGGVGVGLGLGLGVAVGVGVAVGDGVGVGSSSPRPQETASKSTSPETKAYIARLAYIAYIFLERSTALCAAGVQSVDTYDENDGNTTVVAVHLHAKIVLHKKQDYK